MTKLKIILRGDTVKTIRQFRGNPSTTSSKIELDSLGTNRIDNGHIIFRWPKAMRSLQYKLNQKFLTRDNATLRTFNLDTNLTLDGIEVIKKMSQEDAITLLSDAEKAFTLAFIDYTNKLPDEEAQFEVEQLLPKPPTRPGHVQVHTRNATGGICSYLGGRHLVLIKVLNENAIAYCPVSFELLKIDLTRMICIPL